jgi:3-oxoadipate enol-lactonase
MEVNGKGIAVDIFGDGASILMIRGFGRTRNVWCARREVLARSFRVICPDLEGSGCSPLEGELSIDGFVADMAPLLGTLNISSAHVVGYSLATMVCQRLAVNCPERANSLVSPSQHVRVGLLERARNVPMNGNGRHFTSDRAIDSNQGGHQSESRCVPAGENAAGYAGTCEAPARAMPALPMRIRRHRRRKSSFGEGDRSALIFLNRVAHMTPLERPQEVNQALSNFYLDN